LTASEEVAGAGAPPIALVFLSSRDVRVFHVVDQLSRWSEFCHPAYRESFGPFTDEEEAMLERHALLRQREYPLITGQGQSNGWQSLFEGLFYTSESAEKAADANVSLNNLSDDEAREELAILDYFGAKLGPWLDGEEARMSAVEEKIEASLASHRPKIERLMRFFGVAYLKPIPTVLVPSPSSDSVGGGMNSGVMTIEVPIGRDVTTTLLHELVHALMGHLGKEIAAAANSADFLDPETLEEGIAHAIAPGLLGREGGAGTLERRVERMQGEGRTLGDPYLRFHLLGLKLMPHLERALRGEGSIRDFLKTAASVWNEIPREEHAQAAVPQDGD